MNNTILEMHDALIQTTDWLSDENIPVALVLTETLEPASGKEAEIFPPTFAKDDKATPKDEKSKHPYNIDELRDDSITSFKRENQKSNSRNTTHRQYMSPETASQLGETVNICLIDSIGSQANRMETHFKQQPLASLVPQIVITANGEKANLLDIGHRIADAAIRYSDLKNEVQNAILSLEKKGDALEIAKIAPTSLIFGFWDSRGGTKYKFGRILSSIIRATNVSVLSARGQSKPAFQRDKIDWEDVDTKTLAKYGLDDVPVPTNDADAGVIRDENGKIIASHAGVKVFGKITRRTQINLVGLRALAVTNADGEIDETKTLNLRRYLLGLALIAARRQSVYDLRVGCILVKASEESQAVYSDNKRLNFDWSASLALDYARTSAQNFDETLSNRSIREAKFDVKNLKDEIDNKNKKEDEKKKKSK